MADQCRSCGAAVIWVRTPKGKMMILDAEPVPDGNFVLDEGVAVSAANFIFAMNMPRYMTHWATCPFAKQHRKEAK